jgi:hypothetical protein
VDGEAVDRQGQIVEEERLEAGAGGRHLLGSAAHFVANVA